MNDKGSVVEGVSAVHVYYVADVDMGLFGLRTVGGLTVVWFMSWVLN